MKVGIKRRARKLVAGLAMLVALPVAAVTTDAVVAPAAGASFVVCPGSPTNDGWFPTTYNGVSGSVNCTYDQNHIVVDYHNSSSNGTCTSNAWCSQGAIDIWYTPNLSWNAQWFSGGRFRLGFYQGLTSYPPMWATGLVYETPNPNPVVAYQDEYVSSGSQTKYMAHVTNVAWPPTGSSGVSVSACCTNGWSTHNWKGTTGAGPRSTAWYGWQSTKGSFSSTFMWVGLYGN